MENNNFQKYFFLEVIIQLPNLSPDEILFKFTDDEIDGKSGQMLFLCKRNKSAWIQYFYRISLHLPILFTPLQGLSQ